jgi:alpha-1,3/alpha-1,6-mannosyltransferase
MADGMVVNSEFTAKVFQESFPSIRRTPQVLYPGIHFESYDREIDLEDERIRALET